jgi:hypothetical protein
MLPDESFLLNFWLAMGEEGTVLLLLDCCCGTDAPPFPFNPLLNEDEAAAAAVCGELH